jgi:hypothetical protein
MPLWAYVTQAVHEKLAAELHPDKPWMKSMGGLRHLHKENLRIQKLIDEEFGRLEPEDLF